MEILLVTPAPGGVATGNRETSRQWADTLRGLGHRVEIATGYHGEPADLLIALHAHKSHGAISRCRRESPGTAVVVALTGTDLYPRLTEKAVESMRQADRVVVFQEGARGRLPGALREKAVTIVQAAEPPRDLPGRSLDPFDVAVVGHLRAVKDPMRAAEASRLLPPSSKVRVRHAGAVLEPEFRDAVAREQHENPRYAWLGELSPEETVGLIASSQALVLSSHSEGGGRVIGEAVVCGTPVLASRNDATLSHLGENYPGLFDTGDTAALAGLIARLESDPAFQEIILNCTSELTGQFDPAREAAAWQELLAGLPRASHPGSHP